MITLPGHLMHKYWGSVNLLPMTKIPVQTKLFVVSMTTNYDTGCIYTSGNCAPSGYDFLFCRPCISFLQQVRWRGWFWNKEVPWEDVREVVKLHPRGCICKQQLSYPKGAQQGNKERWVQGWDETTETFVWVLQALKEAMVGLEPRNNDRSRQDNESCNRASVP